MGRFWILPVMAFIAFPQRGLSFVDPASSASTARSRFVENRKDPVTTVLYCASGEVDIFLAVAVSGCVDSELYSYYVVSAGTGFSVGVSGAAFTLVYRSYDGSEISGSYYGGTVSGAWGVYGATVGVFYPFESSDRHGNYRRRRRLRKENRLYRIGYVAGVSVDLSGAVLTISRL